ncbi:MAG: hypothetical protein PF508_02625 [Spirochaeta sp.]|jgi:hypothetical protein|nr:hypothetical protein [Spirochaeta sp.]
MHIRRVRRYLILPILYVGVIFGLLFLQFSGRLTVRQTIAGLEFTGTLIAGADETSQEITAARIAYEGIRFSFSESEPVVVANDDGADARVFPERYEIEEQELRITFSDGSVMRFIVSESENPELHIIPMPTNEWPRDGQLVVPYRLAADSEAAEPDPNNPEIQEIAFDERRFFLSAPPRTAFDTTQNQLVIPLSAGSQMVRYAEVTSEVDNVIEAAFSDGERQIGAVRYEQTMSDYLDLAYFGWATERFNGGSGTWRMRDGGPRFSENILTAYLAEAWRRNDYPGAFNQMRRAADLHPQEVGFQSTVFLGNLRTVSAQTLAANAERTARLSSRIAAGDPTVFRDEDLIPFAAHGGSEALYEQVLDYAEIVDFRTVGIPAAVGMLVAAADIEYPSPAAREATRRFLAIVEERIFPAVRRFDEFFFLETAQGEVDVYWSIRAGQLVEMIGREQDDELYVTVGRNLVMSGLQLADPQGFLPAFLYFNETGIQRREGSFGPERLYSVFTDNPWYPRRISLYEELGAGSFIWTIANFTRVDIGEEQFSFRLEYPANQTHYIIMQGIPAFDSMQLFGLQWRNDLSFESYIKGRHYEASTETLMIKYTDNSTAEEILLYY